MRSASRWLAQCWLSHVTYPQQCPFLACTLTALSFLLLPNINPVLQNCQQLSVPQWIQINALVPLQKAFQNQAPSLSSFGTYLFSGLHLKTNYWTSSDKTLSKAALVFWGAANLCPLVSSPLHRSPHPSPLSSVFPPMSKLELPNTMKGIRSSTYVGPVLDSIPSNLLKTSLPIISSLITIL